MVAAAESTKAKDTHVALLHCTMKSTAVKPTHEDRSHKRSWQEAVECVVVRGTVLCNVSLRLLVAVVVKSIPIVPSIEVNSDVGARRQLK